MAGDEQKNSWNEWSRHVLAELQRLNDQYADTEDHIELLKRTFMDKVDSIKDSLHAEAQTLHVEIAMLKVKSGVWGLLGGLVPVLLMILMEVFNRK